MTTFSHLDFLGEGLYNGEQAQKSGYQSFSKCPAKQLQDAS